MCAHKSLSSATDMQKNIEGLYNYDCAREFDAVEIVVDICKVLLNCQELDTWLKSGRECNVNKTLRRSKRLQNCAERINVNKMSM